MVNPILLSIIRDIWERRGSTNEAGNGYTVVLDNDLCERIRQVLDDSLVDYEEEARINELEMWGPEGRPKGPWL